MILSKVDEGSRTSHWRSRPRISRKEIRKEERANRKKNKAAHLSAHRTPSKRFADEDSAEAPKAKKIKRRHSPTPEDSSKPADSHPAIPVTSTVAAKMTKKKTALDKLSKKSQLTRPTSTRTRQEEDEDSYIAYLESRLGYSERGKKKKEVEDDGLDGEPLLDKTV